jgi:DNA-binding response OmpR family regulator
MVSKPRRVLLVDDDPVTLEIVKAALEDAGFAVTTRERAFGTSIVIAEERPDIVLADVTMPGLTGDGLVRVGSGNPQLAGTLFVLYSARRTADLEQLARDVGAAGAIVKTGNMDSFVAEFKRIVERRQTAQGA